MNEIAQRYGEGLFELAKETNTIANKKEDIETLLALVEEEKDVETLLRAVKVKKEEKKQFITDVFNRVVDHDVVSLIKLLIDKGRIFYFKEVLEAYLELADEELGIMKATVYSARKLKDEDRERIRQALEEKMKKYIVLRNQVDESLIAGIKVAVGNNVTDITMKNKIEQMKEALLKGGQA